jgi:vacuolar-type H+-ATPase subunit H
MTPLAELLDRLRRRRQPPGRAAVTVGVPTAEPDTGAELAPLFGQLEEIEREAAAIVEAGRSDARSIEHEAQREAHEILRRAAREADILAEGIRRERLAGSEREARAIRRAAEEQAQRLRERAARRRAGVVDEALGLLIRGSG